MAPEGSNNKLAEEDKQKSHKKEEINKFEAARVFDEKKEKERLKEMRDLIIKIANPTSSYVDENTKQNKHVIVDLIL